MPRLQLQPKTGPSKPQWGTPTANPADAQASWADVHQPRSLAELSLHFSKRNALANWLTKACAFDPCADPRVPVLVLFGGSGIGKSSAVELTCVDMGISVVQWNQDMIDSDSTSSVSLYGSRRRPGSQNESGYGDLVHDLFAVHHSSAGRVEQSAALFRAAKFPSLLLATKEGAVVQSQHVRPTLQRILLVHDPPPPEDPMFGFINDLLLQSCIPVVMIVSGAFEREDRLSALNSCLSQATRSCLNAEGMFWTPITEAKMVKTLTSILKKEKVSSILVPEQAVNQIASISRGDMRHAILQLQMEVATRRYRAQQHKKDAIAEKESLVVNLVESDDDRHEDALVDSDAEVSSKVRRRKKARGQERDVRSTSSTPDDEPAPSSSSGRDTVHSQLRSLAKVLHSVLDASGQTDVDLNDILLSMDSSGDHLLGMIWQNSIDFIDEHMNIPVSTDEKDRSGLQPLSTDPEMRALQICDALAANADCLGDAEIMLTRKFDPAAHLDRSSDNVFPEPYVHALATRATLAAKGVGIQELRTVAKEKLGYKSPFRALKLGGMYRKMKDKKGIDEMLLAMRRECIVQWLEYTSHESEDIERDDAISFMGQYVPSPHALLRHMIPDHTMTEWALVVAPYCQLLLANNSGNSSPLGQERLPMLVEWLGRRAPAASAASRQDSSRAQEVGGGRGGKRLDEMEDVESVDAATVESQYTT